jgi:hypothetical protein
MMPVNEHFEKYKIGQALIFFAAINSFLFNRFEKVHWKVFFILLNLIAIVAIKYSGSSLMRTSIMFGLACGACLWTAGLIRILGWSEVVFNCFLVVAVALPIVAFFKIYLSKG